MDPDRETPSYPSSSDMIDQWHGRSSEPSAEAPPAAPPAPPPPPAPEPEDLGSGDPFAPADPFATSAPAPSAEPRVREAVNRATLDDQVPAAPGPPVDDHVQWDTAPSRGRSGRVGALFGIRALVGIGVILFIAVGAWMARGQKSVVDLEVGDCFDDPGANEELIETVKTVDCADLHDFEVFAVLTAPMDVYPGEDAMFAWADEACYSHFESYTGVPYEQSPYFFTTMIPVADGWAEGDRGVDCVLGLSTNGWDVTPIEGSQRASGQI